MQRQQAENVFGSKLQARQDITAMLLPTLGATALYLLPEFLISIGLSAKLGYFNEDVAASLTDAHVLLYIAVVLAAELFLLQPLYYGLTQFYALRRAGARPSVTIVTMALSSGREYLRAIRLSLLLVLRSALWLVPTAAICGVGYALYRYVLNNSFGSFLMWEIVLFAGVFFLCMVLRYQCAYPLLMEQGNMTCREAIRQAAGCFAGHKRELLSLLLSFLLWILLAVCLTSLLLIYVYPYFLLSLYHLFDRIRGVSVKVKQDKPQ